MDAHFSPPSTTVNVGVIGGGKAKNIIAGSCKFTIEWRPIPGQPVEQVLRAAEKIRDACIAEDPGFTMSLKPVRLDRGFTPAPEHELVRFLAEATGNGPKTVSFGTEGPQRVELGSVPVVFGPGDTKHAHQAGEFVPVEELQRCAEVLERAILHFCR